MTPTDADVRINTTPDLFDDADEVHISCLFSWDKDRAEKLADAWDKAGLIRWKKGKSYEENYQTEAYDAIFAAWKGGE